MMKEVKGLIQIKNIIIVLKTSSSFFGEITKFLDKKSINI